MCMHACLLCRAAFTCTHMHGYMSMFICSCPSMHFMYYTAYSASTACILHKFIIISFASCTSIGYMHVVPPYNPMTPSSLHDATTKVLNEIQTADCRGFNKTAWAEAAHVWLDLAIFTQPSICACLPCSQLRVRQKYHDNLILLQTSTFPLIRGIKITVAAVQSVMLSVVCRLLGRCMERAVHLHTYDLHMQLYSHDHSCIY